MANADIGELVEPFHGSKATIREANTRSGKYPLYIVVDGAQVFCKSARLQDWIRANATWYDNAPACYREDEAANVESGTPDEVLPPIETGEARAAVVEDVNPETETKPEKKKGFLEDII